MPARDYYHDHVKRALVKDGWTITDDPFTIKFEELVGFVDFAAERMLAAERGSERIAVEVKVFGGPSPVADLEQALGQYAVYRSLMTRAREDRVLYLAISEQVFESFFQQVAVQAIVEDYRLKLLVFDARNEEVVQWIN